MPCSIVLDMPQVNCEVLNLPEHSDFNLMLRAWAEAHALAQEYGNLLNCCLLVASFAQALKKNHGYIIRIARALNESQIPISLESLPETRLRLIYSHSP